MRRIRTLITLLIVVSLFWVTEIHATDLDRVAASTVRVDASQCAAHPNSAKRASGFVYARPGAVVTALHVVAGCRQIVVSFERTGKSAYASIVSTLRVRDLVLLRIDGDIGAQALTAVAQNAPRPTDPLFAMGYELTAPTMTSRSFTVKYGATTLRDILPGSVNDALQRFKSPDTTTTIVRLDGALIFGLSGAPLVDRNSSLVGIGDGGLESGAGNISFAISAKYLESLLSRNEHEEQEAYAASLLFSAEEPEYESHSEALHCGDLEFYKYRVRTLTQLLEYSDDRASVLKLMKKYGINGSQSDQISYDIWVEPNSGSSIAIPVGTYLEEGGSYCRGDSNFSYFKMEGHNTSNNIDVHRYESRFLGDIYRHRMDSDPSDPDSQIVRHGEDDFAISHKNFLLSMSDREQGAASVTTIARGNAFVSVGVSNEMIPAHTRRYCANRPTSTICDDFFERDSNMALFKIGMHLSTIPKT